MDDPRLRVCLERRVEIGATSLRLRDWPGRSGPLVHFAGAPRAAESPDWLGSFAPRYRVMSLESRPDSPYQVDAIDLLAMLDQFGFPTPVVVGQGAGCLPALLVAAWHPGRLAGLIMVDPAGDPLSGNHVQARALRDCPPDWTSLRRAVECPVLLVPRPPDAASTDRLEEFLSSL